MKLALCSTGEKLNSTLDERFGRANYFIFYNTESLEMDVIKNSAKEASGGAGGLAVQLLVDNKTEILIAPEIGPQALGALRKFGIPAFKHGSSKTVEDAITAWGNGALKKADKPGNKGLHKA